MPRSERSLRAVVPSARSRRTAGRIVGRDDEIERLTCLLVGDGPAGAVVVGPPGMGRTRLLDAVEARLRADGHLVHRLPIIRAGSIASLLPDLPLPTGPNDQPPIVVLDDVQLLDQATASMLHDLAVTGRARLLLSLRNDARTAEPITALWKDGLCERLPLEPLPRQACTDLVDVLVGDLVGDEVDAATAHRIWTLTRGRPRAVVDLTRGLAESDLLARDGDVLSWIHPDVLPDALLDTVCDGALTELTAGEQDAIDLLVCTGPVGLDLLVDAGADLAALEELERRHVVTARRSGRRLVVEIQDPLLELAARQRLGALRYRLLTRRLAQAWQTRGTRRPGDLARSAVLVLDAGGTPSPDVAEQGARQALARGDNQLAERLARSALASGAGAIAAGYLAEALSAQGRAAEAETVLLGAGSSAEGHPSLQLVRAVNLHWGLADPQSSHRLVEEVLRSSTTTPVRTAATLSLAGFHLHDGRFSEALTLAEQVRASLPQASTRAQQALAVSISALSSLGRDRDAVQRATEAEAEAVATTAHADPPHPATTDAEPPPERTPGWSPTLHRQQLAVALTRAHLVHGDLDRAEELARHRYQRAQGRSLLATATWAALLGEVALLRGRIRTAMGLLEEAAAAAQRSGAGGLTGRTVQILATKNLARGLVLSGRPDDARATLAALGPDSLNGLAAIDLWTGDVDGELTAAESGHEQGVAVVLHTAQQTREQGAWGLYVPALHQAVRLGGASHLPPDPLAGVEVQGPLLRAQADHVRAAATGAAVALEDVAQRYVHIGANLFAAEAAAQAARLHGTAGHEAAARRASSVARACLSRCEGVVTGVTALLSEPPDLTPRQREIARLAAGGTPSKLIAERLVLSVRTVDNCLGQVYRKLGISNRADLARLMGRPDGRECSPSR